jgi:acid phosphatase type 7
LWPIYDYNVLNGSYDQPYTNPRGPVHIVTGSAGCKENHDEMGPAKNFSAFRSTDYGYTRMKVYNSSHLYLEQVSDDQVNEFVCLYGVKVLICIFCLKKIILKFLRKEK